MRWVRVLAGFLLARPFGYLGDTAKPMPYNEVLSLIDTLDTPIAVGACRCRIGHKSCSHPLETDIVIRTGYKAWMKAFPRKYRQISKEEAKAIVKQTHELGMFHMIFVHCPVNLYNEHVICNCCTCGLCSYACPEKAITLRCLRDPILPRDGHGNGSSLFLTYVRREGTLSLFTKLVVFS